MIHQPTLPASLIPSKATDHWTTRTLAALPTSILPLRTLHYLATSIIEAPLVDLWAAVLPPNIVATTWKGRDLCQLAYEARICEGACSEC